MSRTTDTPSRRTVLRTAGGAFAGFSASGLVAGSPGGAVEVNVGFDADDGRTAALGAADKVVREFAFDALTIRMPKKAVPALRQRPELRYVETNGRVHALAQTEPWNIDRVGATDASWDGYTGAGANIAILDTGIDSTHPDFDDLGYGAAFVTCQSGCNGCLHAWDDDSGHGTYCAGIAAAENDGQGTVGVAPDATLHAGKVLGGDGSGTFSTVAAGIEWAADEGFDVANLSIGANSGSQMLEDACEYAHDRGVFLVAAAGNDGCSDCIAYPAAYDEVVTVSATNGNDDLANFSSYGPEIELAAPGTGIDSPYCGAGGGYASVSGTSLAASHVAGAAGILMGQLGYSNSGARSRLKNTAEDIGLPNPQIGAGLLDVAAAVS